MKHLGIWFCLVFLSLTSCVSTSAQDVNSRVTEQVSTPLLLETQTKSAATQQIEPTHTILPTDTAQIVRADFGDFGLAPELENEVWLNTDQPLRLEQLRGKVVLIDMWTFG